MFKITYLWSKFCKKLPLSAIKNSRFEKPSKAEARSTVINSKMGRYSYCGYNCTIINAEIGRFTSIGDNVVIGAANHPLEWISTSPAFYYGKDSIPKNLAKLSYDASPAKTRIGNDVWIGRDVLVRGGGSNWKWSLCRYGGRCNKRRASICHSMWKSCSCY